jgi:hypothetical protein
MRRSGSERTRGGHAIHDGGVLRAELEALQVANGERDLRGPPVLAREPEGKPSLVGRDGRRRDPPCGESLVVVLLVEDLVRPGVADVELLL